MSRMLGESTIQIVRLAAGLLLIVGSMMMARWPIARWPFSSELATTTIGAWCIGMAFHAWWLQRRRTLHGSLPCAVQLAGFGLGLLTIVILHFNNVKLDAGAVLFVVALIGAACAGVIPIAESKRIPFPDDRAMPMIVRIGITGFVLIACYIGGKLMVTRSSSYSDGGIFPERLNEMTLRMFGMFYLSVAIAAASTVFSRSAARMRAFAICSLFVLAMILIASAIHWQLWDFSIRPRTAIYIGVYAIIGLAALVALWVTRSNRAVA